MISTPVLLDTGMLVGAAFPAQSYLAPYAPNSYVTVQATPTWWLNDTNAIPGGSSTPKAAVPITGVNSQLLPFRWFTSSDYNPLTSGTSSGPAEIAIPFVKQVVYDDDLNQDAASLTVQVFNQNATFASYGGSAYAAPSLSSSPPSQPQVLGDPGFFSFLYGGIDPLTSAAQAKLWGRTAKGAAAGGWTNVLREGALLRWYFGYGGVDLSWADAFTAGNVMLKGLWLVDLVSIESNGGYLTLTCRCAGGKLLLDQILCPPLVPQDFYTSSGIVFYPPQYNTYDAQKGYGAPGETVPIDPITTILNKDGIWKSVIDAAVAVDGQGYMLCGSNGRTFGYSDTVFEYGGVPQSGESDAISLLAPIAGMDLTSSGNGYWICDQIGTIYNFGDATNYTNAGITNSATPDGQGFFNALPGSYWAPGAGAPNPAGLTVESGVTNPIVAFRRSATGGGYYMLAQDGTVTVFGDAVQYGPGGAGAVKMAVPPQGGGYWILSCVVAGTAAAPTYTNSVVGWGSCSNLGAPSTGAAAAIESTTQGTGYWIVSNSNPNGSGVSTITAYGNAPEYSVSGSDEGALFQNETLNAPCSTIRVLPDGTGFYVIGMDGGVFSFGSANYFGSMPKKYWLWIPSNYVSWFNTDPGGIYIPIPVTTPTATNPPANATLVLSPSQSTENGQIYADPVLLAPDYSQVVRTIWSWAGGYLPESSTGGGPFTGSTGATYSNPSNPAIPTLLGQIFDSGAYDALGQIDSTTFDKVPCKQAINAMRDAIGYITRFRDDGGLVFCVDENTEALTLRGWLNVNDLHQDDYFYSLNPETGNAEWVQADKIHRFNVVDREMVSLESRNHNSLTTTNHRWLVTSPYQREGETKEFSWVTSETLTSRSAIPTCAPHETIETNLYSDDFIELVGWWFSEGHVNAHQTNGYICQSISANPTKVERIRKLFEKLYGLPGSLTRHPCGLEGVKEAVAIIKSGRVCAEVAREFGIDRHALSKYCREGIPNWGLWHEYEVEFLAGRLMPGGDVQKKPCRMRYFIFNGTVLRNLQMVAPGRVPTKEFLNSLTQNQLTRLIEGAMLGDGNVYSVTRDGKRWTGYRKLYQLSYEQASAFEFACILAGIPVTLSRYDGMWVVALRKNPYALPLAAASARESATVDTVCYTGGVWCPQLKKNHNWFARRQGTTYFTGNTMPNIFIAGNNFYEGYAQPAYNSTYTGADYFQTNYVPLFGEGGILPFQDFTLNSTDAPLRSQILVSPVDPYIYEGSPPMPNLTDAPPGLSNTVTNLIAPTVALDVLHGIVKVAMIGVPLNVPVSIGDQNLMAEFQYIQTWLATRTGTLIAPFHPGITIDSQIQIQDRVTGETSIHYVTAISVTHNLDQGDCLATYTTQWMGNIGDNGWAVGGTITDTSYNSDGGLNTPNITLPISAALTQAVTAWKNANTNLANLALSFS